MKQCHIWPVDSTQDIPLNGEKAPRCDYHSARETLDKFILDRSQCMNRNEELGEIYILAKNIGLNITI